MNELNAEDRKKRIMDLLNREGKVKVVDLSRMFGISEVTIRNNLSELEAAGMLERIHGGAIITHHAYYNMSLKDRMRTNEEEKRRIAVKVVSMIAEGDTVMINSGTTTLIAAQKLKDIKNLTIVTNSVSIAQEIGHLKNIHVILLGGNFDPQYQYTFGDDALHQLKKYKADKLILAADGISSEDGITTYHHLETELNRQMIARVNKTFIVADYTKIGRASFSCIDAIDNVDTLITDNKANQDEINAIREKGVEVILV